MEYVLRAGVAHLNHLHPQNFLANSKTYYCTHMCGLKKKRKLDGLSPMHLIFMDKMKYLPSAGALTRYYYPVNPDSQEMSFDDRSKKFIGWYLTVARAPRMYSLNHLGCLLVSFLGAIHVRSRTLQMQGSRTGSRAASKSQTTASHRPTTPSHCTLSLHHKTNI